MKPDVSDTSGRLTIGTSVTIIGLGAENLFISGNKTYTVFVVTDVSATISGVTIESGFNLGDRGIWVGQGLPLLI